MNLDNIKSNYKLLTQHLAKLGWKIKPCITSSLITKECCPIAGLFIVKHNITKGVDDLSVETIIDELNTSGSFEVWARFSDFYKSFDSPYAWKETELGVIWRKLYEEDKANG